MTSTIEKKYIGVLLGGCCGDILGSQTENMTRCQIKQRFGEYVTQMPSKKQYTDDTEMTLVLARHLVRREGGINTCELHSEYGKELGNRGYSSSTRAILTMFKENPEHGSFAYAGNSSHNGSIMRIAPIGLLKINTVDTMKSVRRACYFTHGDNDDACYSAMIHCRLINAFVANRFNTIQEYWNYVLGHARQYSPLWVKINIVRYCLNQQQEFHDITQELLGKSDIFQIQAIDALCCAYYIFFRLYDNPLKAVQYAASIGGDTDTIAKIVGELCGAAHGIEWIPESWRDMEGEKELIQLGRDMAAM